MRNSKKCQEIHKNLLRNPKNYTNKSKISPNKSRKCHQQIQKLSLTNQIKFINKSQNKSLRNPKQIHQEIRDWLQFWKLRSWIQTNISLTMNCDTGQHSQFLQCFDCISWKNLVEGFLQVNLVHRELQTPKSMMTILDRKCSRFKALLRNSYLSQVMLRWSRDACILFPRMFWFGSPSSPKIEKYIQESFENG